MFYQSAAPGLVLKIKVIPNASKHGCLGLWKDSNGDTYLKIGLHAVPEKGKANKELITFLSKVLKLSKSSFTIISGETDRKKKILLNEELSESLEEKLTSLEKTNDSTNY